MKNLKTFEESEMTAGNTTGKAGTGSLPFGRGYYSSGNSGAPGISFTASSEPELKTYKNTKHSKKKLKEKMKKIKKFKKFIKNEGFFEDYIKPALDPYLPPGAMNKNKYTGKIVDKKKSNKILGGEKCIIYVKIPNKGVETFEVSLNNYYDYQIGQTINVIIEENKKFIKEDACATAGNANGMGGVVAANPSSTPGDVAGGTIGSGDVGQTLGTYTKSIPKLKKGKKKKKKLNESSYSDFKRSYIEEIEQSIKLLIKLQENEDNINYEKVEKRLNVYDVNVQGKIDEWIYDTPSIDEIVEFAIRNQDKFGTEPRMILSAIEDFAQACNIYIDFDEDEYDEDIDENVDNFTARYYDDFDDEEEAANELELQEFNPKNRKIQLFEDFGNNYSFEMSGSPFPHFKTKAEFVTAMQKCGYYHTTLNKKTNMLICSTKDLGTLKFKKAQKYGIPIYTYAQAKKEMKNLINTTSKYNL